MVSDNPEMQSSDSCDSDYSYSSESESSDAVDSDRWLLRAHNMINHFLHLQQRRKSHTARSAFGKRHRDSGVRSRERGARESAGESEVSSINEVEARRSNALIKRIRGAERPSLDWRYEHLPYIDQMRV
ncbi:unnamed protein product [Protopolystoma xenopodis]|uniref:Uncharacterized protein n=1 Tax=Protopolystoma xenopodis TaxID=117903 RepID=A0A3S5BDD6_9PLAT|nr:unnamed protein product [Protopolystoma xenopodis]